MTMVTVSKSALKARMLEYFRQVEETGEPLVVTDHGKPVLQVVPIVPKKRPAEEVIAEYRARATGRLWFVGDPNEPTIDEWDDPWGEKPLE
jgi:prevent-host-death family protein